MSEPKRWLEAGAPPDIEHLVRAAQAERPDEASLARTLSAVGIGLAATSVAANTKAAGAAAGAGTAKVTLPLTGGVLAKWATLAATVGTLTVGAVKLATDAPRMAGAPASSSVPSARARPGTIPAMPMHSEPILAAPSAAPHITALVPAGPETRGHSAGGAAAAPAAPADAETLADEVRSIDRARALLAAGRARQTLGVLDEYERRFRKRGFAPEALYLRMEASLALGRTAEARDAAERLLASYPKSLHGDRARTVLSQNPDRFGAPRR
jgi:hypothetical protein